VLLASGVYVWWLTGYATLLFVVSICSCTNVTCQALPFYFVMWTCIYRWIRATKLNANGFKMFPCYLTNVQICCLSKDCWRSAVSTLTGLDISFSINMLCQYLYSPTTTGQWFKWFLRFLKHTGHLGLHILWSSATLVSAFFHADCSEDRKSTDDFAVFFDPNLISVQRSKKLYYDQVLRQSTRLRCNNRIDVWIQSVLQELCIPCS
jgi:hypothetical protein